MTESSAAGAAGRPGIVALVTSAGGLRALTVVLAALPADLDVPVVVLQHLSGAPSLLPALLARHTGHAVRWAADGERVRTGEVVVAPPLTRMTVASDGVVTLEPARHNEHTADALVESVARAYGAHALVAVLTGMGSDGARGAVLVHEAGGIVIAQGDAEFPSMPRAAVATGAVDRVLPLDAIGPAIAARVAG